MHKYNFIQKLLHDAVLSNNFINKSLFEIEKIFYKNKENIQNNLHVFISGMPRSGTTILLNFIYSSEEFASLKYKHMPFILSPNIAKLLNMNNINSGERAHFDGIRQDLNSPEAFDEIFFRQSKSFVLDEIVNYIKLILVAENKNKYLSKNNLNYKRIELISKVFPKSQFLIPIREPLQQSYSLLNQHKNFLKLQKKEDFVRRYMNYLSHHEFGKNHKPWLKTVNFKNTESINYWLEQFTLFYKNILKIYKLNNNCHIINYEKLIDPPYVKKITDKLCLSQNTKLNFNYFKNSNKKNINIKYDKDIYFKALEVYNSLIE